MSREVNRRNFIATLGGTGLMVPALSKSLFAQSPPTAPKNLRIEATPSTPSGSASSALTPSDFELLGSYDVQTFGTDTSYMRSLTHRYVDGQLRLLTLTHSGILHEIAAPSTFGGLVTSTTATWNLSALTQDFTGIWFEEAKQRLWLTTTVDYGSSGTYYPTRISTMTLGANGLVSNVKTVSLQGVNSKRVYGGVVPVPKWFQTQNGVGPYAVGFGGYTSLMAQTSRAALGPELICIPDIAGYGNGAEIPTSAFRVLLDTDLDHRGLRKTIPINYFDGGDGRQNPPTPPTSPPLSNAYWLSPNAQGLGWMVWGDSYYNNAVWIDGPNKQGFAAIASLGKGKCWYQESTLHFDDRQYELHIWDSAALTRGLLTPPTSMAELIVPRANNPMSWDGDVPMCNISGATYDSTTRRLYAVGYPLGGTPGGQWSTGRVYTYSVNS